MHRLSPLTPPPFTSDVTAVHGCFQYPSIADSTALWPSRSPRGRAWCRVPRARRRWRSPHANTTWSMSAPTHRACCSAMRGPFSVARAEHGTLIARCEAAPWGSGRVPPPIEQDSDPTPRAAQRQGRGGGRRREQRSGWPPGVPKARVLKSLLSFNAPHEKNMYFQFRCCNQIPAFGRYPASSL